MKRVAAILTLCTVAVWLPLLLLFPTQVKAPPFVFVGSTSTAATSYLLLDTPGVTQWPAGVPAASIRLLTTNYTGYCMSIVTNDVASSTVADIGWMTNAGKIYVDAAAITNFAQGQNAWVYIWYDQTTNAIDFTGNTAITLPISMPLIAIAGEVIVDDDNGFPALSTTNLTVMFGTGTTPTAYTSYTAHWVGKTSSAVGNQLVFIGPNILIYAIYDDGVGPDLPWGSYLAPYQASSYFANAHHFYLGVCNAADDVDLYTDNEAVETKTGGTAYWSDDGTWGLFGYAGAGQLYVGKFQEFVYLDSATNSVSAIKNNVNAFYSAW